MLASSWVASAFCFLLLDRKQVHFNFPLSGLTDVFEGKDG